MAITLKDFTRLFVREDGEAPPPDLSPKPNKARRFLQKAGTSIDQIISLLIARPNHSGQQISVEGVLGLSPVFRGLDILGDSLASGKLQVKQLKPNGDKVISLTHPVYKLFAGEVHPAYTTYDLIHAMIVQVSLFGNSYSVISRDKVTGYPTRITLLEPDQVKMKILPGDEVIYEYEPLQKTFPAKDIIHLGGLSWNAISGINVLEILRENFGIALANQEYLAKFFANGATMSGVLVHPGNLTDEAAERIESSWLASYGGAQNSGLVPILEEGMEYKPVGLSPHQASSGEIKKLSIGDVARILGVPQFLLEDLDRATFNNVEHLSGMFLKHTIRPRARRTEAEFNRKLFPKDEQGEFFLEFDLSELLISDMKSKGEYIDTLMKWGILNRDEIRQMEGYNKIKDGSGEEFFLPLNMGTVENIKNNEGKEKFSDSDKAQSTGGEGE